MSSHELPEIELITGAPSVLASPFAAMHGLPSPLAGPYGNGVAPGGGIAGLGGFSLGAGTLGVRVPGSPQISSVLLVTNLNEEVSPYSATVGLPHKIPFIHNIFFTLVPLCLDNYPANSLDPIKKCPSQMCRRSETRSPLHEYLRETAASNNFSGFFFSV